MNDQVVFDVLLGAEGRQDGVPLPVPPASKAEKRFPAPGKAPSPARAGRRRSGPQAPAEREGWTPERVESHLTTLGLDPANLVVGPDMLKSLPFCGVRRVEWEEPHRRACFPLRFLPKWRWEPYFVTAPFDGEGIGMVAQWVALGREPSGLRPYWLAGEFAEPCVLALGKPVLPACFVIGPEHFGLEAGPRGVPPAVREAVAGASVLDEALEALRGRPVWLEQYATGAVGHVVSRPFVLKDFQVNGVVRAGLSAGEDSARVVVDGYDGFGFEVENVVGFRVFPEYVIIDSHVPGSGYNNSVTVRWGKV